MRRILAALFLVLAALPGWAVTAEVLGKGDLPMYGSPSGRGRRGQVPAGAEVQVIDDRGGAVKVSYRGAEGWVKGSRLRVHREAPPPQLKTEAPAPVPAVAPPAAAPAADRSYGTGENQPPPAAAPSAPAPPAAAPSPGYLTQYDREEAAPKVDAGPSLFTAVSALLFVLALVAGVVYLVKLFSGRRVLGGAKARGIQVLASRSLGPRQALLLVEVGGLPLLLAQSEGMVNLIAEIRDSDAVRRLNDLYGFRDTPFEAELRSRLDVEADGTPGRVTPASAVTSEPAPGPGRPSGPIPEEPVPSAEERLAALRRRHPSGEQ